MPGPLLSLCFAAPLTSLSQWHLDHLHACTCRRCGRFRAYEHAPDGGRSWTALMLAVRHGSAQVVNLLLKVGADANATANGNPWTPLMLASASCHIPLLRALLDQGIDTTLPSNRHALHAALSQAPPAGCGCIASSCQLCKALLQKDRLQAPAHRARHSDLNKMLSLLAYAGTPLETADYMGRTPLAIAAELGYISSVRLLLSHGASAISVPVLAAAVRGCSGTHSMLKCLLAAVPQGAWKAETMGNAMKVAVEKGCAGCVTLLCRCGGMDANAAYTAGTFFTPVLHAACRGVAAAATLDALLGNGAAAEPFAPGCWPSALWFAVRAGSASNAAALLQAGAPVNTCSPHTGYTALMLAACLGDLPCVMLLVATSGAAVACAARDGTSALMIAAESGHPDIAQYLLCMGADPCQMDCLRCDAERRALRAHHIVESNASRLRLEWALAGGVWQEPEGHRQAQEGRMSVAAMLCDAVWLKVVVQPEVHEAGAGVALVSPSCPAHLVAVPNTNLVQVGALADDKLPLRLTNLPELGNPIRVQPARAPAEMGTAVAILKPLLSAADVHHQEVVEGSANVVVQSLDCASLSAMPPCGCDPASSMPCPGAGHFTSAVQGKCACPFPAAPRDMGAGLPLPPCRNRPLMANGRQGRSQPSIGARHQVTL
jgi:ankyrin repeat protein